MNARGMRLCASVVSCQGSFSELQEFLFVGCKGSFSQLPGFLSR